MKKIKQTLKMTRRATAFWWKRSPNTVLAIAFDRLCAGVTPYVLLYFTALFLNEISGDKDIKRLTLYLILLLCATLLTGVLSAVCSRWKKAAIGKADLMQGGALGDKYMGMDYCVATAQDTLDLYSKIRQYANWANWGLGRYIETLELFFSAVVQILGGLFLVFSAFTAKACNPSLLWLNNPLLIPCLFLIIMLCIVLSSLCQSKAQGYWLRNSETVTASNRLFSFFSYIGIEERHRNAEIRLYEQDRFFDSMLNKTKHILLTEHSPLAKHARRGMGFLVFLSKFLSYGCLLTAYLFISLKAAGGAFGVGSVAQYLGSVTSMCIGLTLLLDSLGEFYANAPYLEKAFEFLDKPNVMYQGSLTTEKRSDRNYTIEFKNVSFRYPGSDRFALKNVSMRFNISSRLAVVGENGSGKTTFIKLLCRLYDPTEGEILLNGINIKKYRYDDYLNLFSVVFQDFKLTSLSVAENIAASSTYDEKRVIDCMEKAGLVGLDIHSALYKDLDNNGIEISGGEAQKIAIARAIYKDSPFIILDEPTASLDPIAEAEIYGRFNDIITDKTAIYISHRLSSCKFCDEIAVFDNGGIVQFGSHDALLSDEGGKYYELWNAQAQYYGKAQE